MYAQDAAEFYFQSSGDSQIKKIGVLAKKFENNP